MIKQNRIGELLFWRSRIHLENYNSVRTVLLRSRYFFLFIFFTAFNIINIVWKQGIAYIFVTFIQMRLPLCRSFLLSWVLFRSFQLSSVLCCSLQLSSVLCRSLQLSSVLCCSFPLSSILYLHSSNCVSSDLYVRIVAASTSRVHPTNFRVSRNYLRGHSLPIPSNWCVSNLP